MGYLLVLAAGLLAIGCNHGSPVPTDGGPSGDAGACSANHDCALCCNTANKDENQLAVGYVIHECACKDKKAPCSGQCQPLGNDICAEPGASPSEACVKCLDGELSAPASACVGAAETTCAGDKQCAPLLDCLRGCP